MMVAETNLNSVSASHLPDQVLSHIDGVKYHRSLFCSLRSCFSPQPPLTERTLMALTIPTGPDEETPLLGGRQVSEITTITGLESEAVTLRGTSEEGSRTPSIKGKTSINEPAGVVKKTPLPWVQFCIVLFLQLPEPLTAQIIYPVSVLFSPIASMYLTRSRNAVLSQFAPEVSLNAFLHPHKQGIDVRGRALI